VVYKADGVNIDIMYRVEYIGSRTSSHVTRSYAYGIPF